jgi:glycosyltransferase involved in cell wall biosynthesis
VSAAAAGRPPRIAIVHDWLVTYAGSERVLEQMLAVLPEADLYAVCDFVPPAERAFLGGRTPRTTLVQKLPLARQRYRSWLPVMPFAIEQLDVTGYDIVVSSSHAVAKGVLTGPDQLHLCLCYSPIRYAWDLQHQYLRQAGLGWGPSGLAARVLLKRLRDWDARSANGVDAFIGISEFVGRRIRKTYRRESTVIYPPVDIERFTPAGERGDYYVTASRMVPYKCVDVIVEAFRAMPDRKLVVIGDGPQMPLVREKAGDNVTLLGHQPFPELLRWLRGARAYLFAAIEDFGIAPLEAQAVGTPVIAYAGGALPETIPGLGAESPCGVLFDEQTPAGVRTGIAEFEANADRITPEACRENARRFSPERFRAEFGAFVEREWAAFDDERRRGVAQGRRRTEKAGAARSPAASPA